MKQKIESAILKVHDKIMLAFLFVVYIIVLGPTSLYLKMIRHNKLPSNDISGDSSWIAVPSGGEDIEDYKRQF